MSIACPSIDDAAFLDSALRFIDCQAQTLGSSGYQALAASGSIVSLLLASLLTIFIAIIGYRLLLGDGLEIRDGVLAAVKIGIVLALATSWPAFRTLIYYVVLHGPAELVSEIGRDGNLPGSSGGMVARLDQVDRAFVVLGQYGPGGSSQAARVRNVDGQNVIVTEPVSEPPSIFGTTSLGTARIIFLTATIASFASVRIVAGLLLALTPFFIAFLLFAGTRGILEGWIKTLAAAAIGAIAVTVILSIELALLEPWLARLIALRQAQLPIGGAATELLVVALVFALTLLAGLGMAARLTLGFRFIDSAIRLPASLRQAISTLHRSERAQPGRQQQAPAEQRSRAAAIANAVAEVQRRETLAGMRAATMPAVVSGAAGAQTMAGTPLGSSHRRRSQTRVSASALRRDKTK